MSTEPTFKDLLWFAEKFVSLLIEQHRPKKIIAHSRCCDLLKNSYLCLLNNTMFLPGSRLKSVVICWKIRIFAYWTTPYKFSIGNKMQLWFAEKFVSLLIEQHLVYSVQLYHICCDLLKNSYLCLLNNTDGTANAPPVLVVICWKIRIFAYWTTPNRADGEDSYKLWFAEKFVSLLIEQHPPRLPPIRSPCCDLLKNSYLCLLNNTRATWWSTRSSVVICWKIRIFAYWTTPGR